MADLAGVDIGMAPRPEPDRKTSRDALAAEGRWGQKKQAGFYDYDAKRTPTPLPPRRRDHRGMAAEDRHARSMR
ncbi:MAG: hypothetical protein PGN08_09595 [Sphingomonas taxi]